MIENQTPDWNDWEIASRKKLPKIETLTTKSQVKPWITPFKFMHQIRKNYPKSGTISKKLPNQSYRLVLWRKKWLTYLSKDLLALRLLTRLRLVRFVKYAYDAPIFTDEGELYPLWLCLIVSNNRTTSSISNYNNATQVKRRGTDGNI